LRKGPQCTCINIGHSSVSHGLSVNVTHSTQITSVFFKPTMRGIYSHTHSYSTETVFSERNLCWSISGKYKQLFTRYSTTSMAFCSPSPPPAL
jgi:hypothetical protein